MALDLYRSLWLVHLLNLLGAKSHGRAAQGQPFAAVAAGGFSVTIVTFVTFITFGRGLFAGFLSTSLHGETWLSCQAGVSNFHIWLVVAVSAAHCCAWIRSVHMQLVLTVLFNLRGADGKWSKQSLAQPSSGRRSSRRLS